MKLRLTIFFGLLLSCLYPSLAQQVSIVKYSVYDGLVANPVRCVYQDRKGFIWIGTFEGISRYDGFRFTNYTTTNGLSHDFINSIYEVDSKVLVAENNGAVDMIHDNKIVNKFRLTSAANYIAPFKDRLFVSTDTSGFYEYDGEKMKLPQQESTGLALGNFVEYNDSLLVSDGINNHFFIYTKDLKIYSALYNTPSYFQSLMKDSKNRIWVCSSTGLKLLKVPEKRDGRIEFLPPPAPFNISGVMSTQVNCMLEEGDGSYWIGTVKGLIHLFPGGDYQVLNEKDGLPSAFINTLYRDREKNIWIGTSLGLAKWVSRNNVTFYNTEFQDFKNDISDIFPLSSDRFILKPLYDPQLLDLTSKKVQNIKISPFKYVLPVANSNPALGISIDNISIYDDASNSYKPIQKLKKELPEAYNAGQHPSGSLFVATGKGFFGVYNGKPEKLLTHRITAIAFDKKGYAWVGTWTNGLYRISQKINGDAITYTIEDKTSLIGQREVRSLYIDSKDNIWIGTRYGGAFCLRQSQTEKYGTLRFNRQSGLMSEWIKCFAELPNGDMWMGTYLGLDRLVKTNHGYRVFNFSKATNFFAQIDKILPTKDNTWICVANTGFAYFKDEDLHETPPLQASILLASLGNQDNQKNYFSNVDEVRLKPFQNTAHFQFSALGFTNEKQILYTYRLKGNNDTSWSVPANVHEASYASLPPGHYSFEVRTIGWNGQFGTPATFSFFISTPFWKTSWFLALSLALLLAIFYLLYRIRIRQIMRLQEVRNNIATDLHDDIGSSLTNISILSELSSKNMGDPEKAQPFLQRISDEVHTSSQAMDDIIWSVNSRNDSLEETMARMRRYAAELFDNSEIRCHINLEEHDAHKKLSMEQRRDLYLIYKEALNNILKHAGAKNVWIDVRQNQRHLHLKVKDDGKGFDMDMITHRNGLKNLRSRVDKWRGNIVVNSKEPGGTNIEISMPLKD